MIDFKMDIPPCIDAVLNILHSVGHEGYLVGGCVRDAVMGKTPHDYDITTDALPEETKAAFERDCKVIETGMKHGTVTVLSDGEPVEITTFRVDGEYRDNRHPESVRFTPNIEEDLARRDFTVNAIAYSPRKGIVDPFGGVADIERRIIRCVGKPDKRFCEDGLRILRGLRFAATLGLDIDSDTADSIHRNRELLRGISAERIYVDFTKLLCGDFAEGILKGFSETFRVFAPDVDSAASAGIVSGVPNDKNLRLAAFLSLSGKESAELFMQSMKADGAAKKETVLLVSLLDEKTPKDRIAVKRLAAKCGIETAKKYALLARAVGKEIDLDVFCGTLKAVKDEKMCLSIGELAVNGGDLISEKIAVGREIGVVLSALLDEVIDEKIENKKDVLLAEARRIAKAL